MTTPLGCGVCDPNNDGAAAIQAPAGASKIACKRHGTLGGAQFCVFCLRAHGDHLGSELEVARRVVEAARALLDALPRCMRFDGCPRMATHEDQIGEALSCEQHRDDVPCNFPIAWATAAETLEMAIAFENGGKKP